MSPLGRVWARGFPLVNFCSAKLRVDSRGVFHRSLVPIYQNFRTMESLRLFTVIVHTTRVYPQRAIVLPNLVFEEQCKHLSLSSE